MSVKRKLLLSFFIIVILFLVSGVTGFISLNSINDSVKTMSNKNLPQKNIISQSVLTMEKAISSLKTYVMSYEDSALLVDNINRDLDILTSYLKILKNGEKKNNKLIIPKLDGDNLKQIIEVIDEVKKVKTIMAECVSVHAQKVDLHFELYSKMYNVEIYFYRLTNKDFNIDFKDWYKDHRIKNKRIQQYIDKYAQAYDKTDKEKQAKYSSKVIKTAARTLDIIEESERINFKILMDEATKISNKLQNVEENIEAEFINSQENIDNIFSTTFIFNIVIIFLAILGSIIIATYVSKNIINSLNSFQKSLLAFFRFINDETKDIEFIDIKSNDEFGQMAKVLNENIETSTKLHKEIANLMSTIDKNIISSEINSQGIITNVSEALCESSGYTKEELIGKSHTILTAQDEKTSYIKDMFKTTKSGKIYKSEVKNIKKDGSTYWVDLIASPKYAEDGTFNGYTAIKHDINAKKAVEEMSASLEVKIKERTAELNQEKNKAQLATKAKGEFLANMSHEIRTPLNAILGFIELLKEKTINVESLKYLNIIDKSSQSLLGIINDILDFSKIESNKLEIEFVEFDPKDEFESTSELFIAKCKEKSIDFKINIQNMPDNLNSDILRIKQIVSNLLSNAIKFTPEFKTISLDIDYKDDKLNISVTDEGIGIAEDKLSSVFEEFTQAEGSTTRKYGGTGLGLSISKKLVALLGGELQVESKLDVGSRFYFSIPMQIGKSTTKRSTKDQEHDFSDKKILLVEDNESNQMLMKIILNKMSLQFEIANDGLEAIKAFKANKYDAILMDENMPNMCGIEATKQILKIEKRESIEHTPIIALTANALKGDREKFLKAGMDEYLTKPINKKKLGEVLIKFI